MICKYLIILMEEAMEHKVELSFWKKGMKISCPECGKKVKEPYKCKCGAVLKPFVRLKKF